MRWPRLRLVPRRSDTTDDDDFVAAAVRLHEANRRAAIERERIRQMARLQAGAEPGRLVEFREAVTQLHDSTS